MAEIVAEMLDRHDELTTGELCRVLWAVKFKTLMLLVGIIVGSFASGSWIGWSIGSYIATTNSAEPTLRYGFDINVHPFDQSLPQLSDAVFDARSLDDFGAEVDRRKEQRDKLTGLDRALQETKSLYADAIGKRFTWSGTVTRISVAEYGPKRKIISVSIKSGSHTADCLFEEQGHIGRLLSLDEGDRITVTGVVADYGDLVRCEFAGDSAVDVP